MPLKPHVIAQGEYLSKLAFSLGFSADEVWSDPKNADLKASRANMDVLSPGDLVWIPDAPPKGLAVKQGKVNRYRVKVPTVPVALTLQDHDGKPLAGKKYTAYGLGDPVQGSTNSDGKVSLALPIHARHAQLVLEDGRVYHVGVGDMDPIEEMSGVKKRLAHLGYYTILPNDEDTTRIKSAIEKFQTAQGLPVTGVADDATKKALVAAHGS